MFFWWTTKEDFPAMTDSYVFCVRVGLLDWKTPFVEGIGKYWNLAIMQWGTREAWRKRQQGRGLKGRAKK